MFMGIKMDNKILYPSVSILSIKGNVIEFRDHLGRKNTKHGTQCAVSILVRLLKSGCNNIELMVVDGMVQEVICVSNCPIDLNLVA